MKCSHFICFLLLLYRNINTTQCEEQNFYRITDKVFTCSKWLSSIIDNFCNNVYKIVKRDTSIFMDKLTPKDLQNSRKMLAEKRWRRVRRQVASECCERPCTVGNIIMYCPDDAKLLRENPSIFEHPYMRDILGVRRKRPISSSGLINADDEESSQREDKYENKLTFNFNIATGIVTLLTSTIYPL